MNNNYLIPANSKKSMLILGFFTPIDLVIFGIGCTFTLVMLFVFNSSVSLGEMLLILSPALVSAFLVMPVPNYHNVLQLITNIVTFIFGRKRYYWKGWCVKDEK
jgi:hypothetical protein